MARSGCVNAAAWLRFPDSVLVQESMRADVDALNEAAGGTRTTWTSTRQLSSCQIAVPPSSSFVIGLPPPARYLCVYIWIYLGLMYVGIIVY